MTQEELLKLLPELTKSKVQRFKWDGLEIVFHAEQSKEAESNSTEQIVDVLKRQEEQLPVDLRTDNINSYDAVLNWSGSPDQTQEELPLTGDQPL